VLGERMDRSCCRCSSGTHRPGPSHWARVVESGQIIKGTPITGPTVGSSRPRSWARLR
jgi:hypothetical protein